MEKIKLLKEMGSCNTWTPYQASTLNWWQQSQKMSLISFEIHCWNGYFCRWWMEILYSIWLGNFVLLYFQLTWCQNWYDGSFIDWLLWITRRFLSILCIIRNHLFSFNDSLLLQHPGFSVKVAFFEPQSNWIFSKS